MARQSSWRPQLATILSLALAGWAADASAAGFQLVEQSGSGLGNAHSGAAAAAEDASTIFFNPAGMTRLRGKQAVLVVNGIGISTTFANSGSSVPFLPAATPTSLPVPLGGAGGNAGKWTPVPNAYLSWQLGERSWLGLGVNVPFGLETDWDPTWVGRFHAVKSRITTIDVNPAFAYEVSDALSIAVGADYQRLDATLSSAVPYGGIAVATASQFGAAATGGILAQLGGAAGLAREGLSTIEGDSTAWGFNAGILFHPSEDLRIGLTYRSRYKHSIEGDVAFENAPTFGEAGALGALGAGLNAAFAPGTVMTDVELPDIFSIAVSLRPTERIELRADYTFTGWSKIQDLTIVRGDGSTLSSVALNFDDSWRTGLGFNYQLNDEVRLRLGVAYDKTPVQDTFRTPRLPDQNRVWAAGGVQYKMGENGALDLGYAHIFVKDAQSGLSFDAADVATAFRGTLVGSYTANVNVVSVQYSHRF